MSEVKKLFKEKNKAISQGQYKEAASICNALGSELYDQEKYEEALQQHLEELGFNETTGDQLGIAVANRRIGECYAMLNNFKKALLHVRKFYDISVSLKSVIEEQRAWATFGRTYYLKYLHESVSRDNNTNSKTLDQAELAYYKALKLLYSLGSEIKPIELAEMKCRLLLNLGLVCDTRGDYKGSAKYVKQGLEIATEYNLYEDIHRCGYALGTLYQKNEKHGEAAEILDLALSASKKLHNKNLTCEVLLSKALSLISLERYGEAKVCLKSAYKLHPTNDEDYEKIIKTLKVCIGLYTTYEKLKECKDLKERKLLLEKIADGLSSVSCYKLAIKKYALTLDCMEEMQLSPSEKAPIYYSLAQTYLDDDNISKSLEYFEREYCCHEGKPQEQLSTVWKMIDVHEKEENMDKAEELYLKAVSLSEKTGNKKIIHSSLSKLLSFYKEINKVNEAKDIKEKLESIRYECLSEDEVENEEESQDLFGDICLSDLSDSDNNESNEEIITSRKRTKKVEAKVNEKGETPLHQACINGNLNAVKRLVESGHSVNVRDYCGWTPLHEACNYGFYDIVEYLLEKGANINDPGGPACGGITALHDAASCGNFDVIHLLVSRGASVTVVDKNGETPLEALLQWKKRSIGELDDITLKQCKSTEEELRSKMKEAGLSIDNSKFSGIGNLSHSLLDVKRQSGEKRCRSPSLHSDGDSSNDSDCLPPYINNIDYEKDWDDADDAKAEYKSVMESLRRNTAVTSPIKRQSPIIVEDSPLLNENEVVDEWLIKDTNQIPRQSKKKRKRAKLNVRTSKCIDKYLIPKDSTEETVNHRDISLIEEDSSCSISSTNSGDKNAGENILQPSRTDNPKLAFCLRVHIANKVILVPVPDDICTISWLSEEAAKRFQNLDGSKPHLTITKDGALLSCSDLVKNIFSNNEEVFTSVEMWDDPSLEDKYTQICNKRKIVVLPSIQKRLQCLESSSELDFSNCNIPPSHLNVIFCTLINYKSLQHLNITGTCLCDTGLSDLISCFPSFSNLISLNLSCCSLTSQSLKNLTDYINCQALKSDILPSLKLLDLSFNNFSQCMCFSALFTLTSIVSLNASSCNLPSSVLANDTMREILKLKHNLEEFDISGNILDSDVISNVLSYLPKMSLKKLNLSHTLEKESEIGSQFHRFFSGVLPCLSELLLQGCCLTDSDVNQIAEGLLYCPQLQICDLSANPSLSSHSLCTFINKACENNLNIADLNLTGTCVWSNYDFINLSNIFKLKSLKHICFDNCPEDITNKLDQMWTTRWGSRAVCINLGFCELKVK